MLIFMKHTGIEARLYRTEAWPSAAVADIGITAARRSEPQRTQEPQEQARDAGHLCLSLFAFLSAEELLCSVVSRSFCASCHNNEMSRHERSFKFEVSGVKQGKGRVQGFTLHTSNSAEGRSCETKPRGGRQWYKQNQLTGAFVRNKANLPRPARGLNGPKVRNKPNFHPRKEIGGASPTLHVGAIAPNKPNSARPAGRLRPREGQTCETKPIRGRPDRRPGPIVQDEPNFGGAGWNRVSGTRDNCAKQSQSPTAPGFDWSLALRGAIMVACRGV